MICSFALKQRRDNSMQTATVIPLPNASLWTRPMLDRQLERLDELAGVGLEIARALERQAKGELLEGAPPIAEDIALAYSRTARAVRLTIALQSKLTEDFSAFGPDSIRARLQASTLAGQEAKKLRPSRRLAVHRIAQRVILGEAEDQETADQLNERVVERLDDEGFCDLLNQPFSEIVAQICKDLGLSPDWPALAEEAWARTEIASGRCGEPLAPYARFPLQGGRTGDGGGERELDPNSS
jgi:hypothetical protein